MTEITAVYEKIDKDTVAVTKPVSKENLLRRRTSQVNVRTRADGKI